MADDIATAPCILGVDVARSGDDAEGASLVHGLQPFRRSTPHRPHAGLIARQWEAGGTTAEMEELERVAAGGRAGVVCCNVVEQTQAVDVRS
jgi:hypothetical protein